MNQPDPVVLVATLVPQPGAQLEGLLIGSLDVTVLQPLPAGDVKLPQL
ncbi:hypothetical protein K7711_33160 [Nocardia sp. CA2R105]|nr:hypothetical protein [Nocardia coffeae]MBY8861366.1 hypothetical protein [Nocardia coffeae]